jgi:hypothetical protein
MCDQDQDDQVGCMKKTNLKQFLAKYGRFVEAGRFFYQYRLHERLTALGFRVISIERLDTHPVWNIRLRGNLEAQANLLLGKCYKGKRPASWGSREVIEQRLKGEMQSILKSLGQAVKADEINVVRYGGYFQVVFVWPLGQPGKWFPPPKRTHPIQVSGVVQRWIKTQRN